MNESINNLWEEFNGLKNTDDVVVKKATALCRPLVLLALESNEIFFERLKNLDHFDKKLISEKYYIVFYEVSLFYLHFIDRMAFESLEIKQRDIFMNILVFNVCEALFEIFTELDVETKKSTFLNAFNNLYLTRQEEYGKYKKLVPEKEQGFANTLFWEFGKKISEILTGENSDMSINMLTLECLTNPLIQVLELPKLFGGPSNYETKK